MRGRHKAVATGVWAVPRVDCRAIPSGRTAEKQHVTPLCGAGLDQNSATNGLYRSSSSLEVDDPFVRVEKVWKPSNKAVASRVILRRAESLLEVIQRGTAQFTQWNVAPFCAVCVEQDRAAH